MDSLDKAIRRFRRHLATLLVLKYTLPSATVWAFAWGIAVLALRAAGVERLPLLWGLVGLAMCVALGFARTRRRLPSASAVRALLDERSGCGGLLMAGGELDLGGWRYKLPDLTPPRVRWDSRRAATMLAIAVGFVLLTFLAPQSLADLTSGSPLEIDRDINRLIEQIGLLQTEAILDPSRADALKEKLAYLHEQASGKEPARTLEAVDHLRNLVGKAAREATEDRTRRSERLTEADTLAEALGKSAELLGPKLKMETLAELAGLLDKSGLDMKRLAEHLDPTLIKSMRDKLLDPEQLKKLQEALRSDKNELAHQVEKIHKAGLIDAELLSKFQQAGEFDSANLRAFLKDNKGKTSLADLKGQAGKSGRGGINRGGGDAPLTWRKPGSEKEVKFKEEVLPPGALASLKGGRTHLPNTKRAQVVVQDKPGGPASSGALRGAAAGSGSANTDTLLPRHRAAVERYFERTSPKKPQVIIPHVN